MTLAPPDGTALAVDQATSLSEAQAAVQAVMLEQKKQEWGQWVTSAHSRMRNSRRQQERQWYINLAFVKGKQNIAVTTSDASALGFQLVTPKAPPWRVRMVVNKIRVAVRTETSKLTSNKPIPVVMPATTEDEDYAAARVGEQILKSRFQSGEFDNTIRSFAWWGSVTGNSFLKSFWDMGAKDESGQPGIIQIERVTPFHIFVPNLLEEDLEKQPFVMHVSTKDPAWIERSFGVKVNATVSSTTDILETSFLNLIGQVDQLKDSCMFYEVWIKPGGHKDFPEGGLISMAGDKVVQAISGWDNLVPFQEYPFYKFNGIRTGAFYTDSVIVDLIPIQKEYNRTKSQIIENKNLSSRTKMLAQRGSMNPRQVTSEPGQTIFYEPGFDAPRELQRPEIPQYVQIELDRLASDFDDISGQHEITRGNTPSQVTSGTAISFLQEQDDSKIADQVASMEWCVSKLGAHYLKFINKYYDPGRIVKIAGRDNVVEVIHWQQSQLKGNTDVSVVPGSALPKSQAARQAYLLDLAKMGLVPPEQFLELADLGNMEKVLEDILVDKRQAQRENLKMSSVDPNLAQKMVQPTPMPMMDAQGNPLSDPNTGQPMSQVGPDGQPVMMPPQPPLPANSYDNHAVHVMVHDAFRKTQQFEILPDPIKQIFELHVQSHRIAQMSAMQPVDAAGNSGVPINPDGSPVEGPPVDPNTGQPMQDPNQQGGPPDGSQQ